MRWRDHNECGIYAEVIAGGSIGVGDAIAAEQPRRTLAARQTPLIFRST
jgi:MOSC domain-containing protein YiiM